MWIWWVIDLGDIYLAKGSHECNTGVHLVKPVSMDNNVSEEIVAWISGQASKASVHLIVHGVPTKQYVLTNLLCCGLASLQKSAWFCLSLLYIDL